MTPTPQEHNSSTDHQLKDRFQGNDVVISGMSGLYPKSRYVQDLEKILYDKINPITNEDVRWEFNHPEGAHYSGNVPDLDRFDAQFFKVHFRLGNNMDSMARKVLEQSYEAIYDAGVNPQYFSGKKVGVYIGTCFSESEKAFFYDTTSRTGFGIAGCSKSMFANRISYWLNTKGPSMAINEACCSSTAALRQAYEDISRGECEAAIVGGTYLCLHPQSSVHYSRIMCISKDGKTKSFDQNAEGCAKSEAINVLFLQNAKDAKRVYAKILHIKSEYIKTLDGETGPRYGFYRDPDDTIKFLKQFYEEAGIPPSVVEYVEAFGSATPEADISELQAIDKVFCNSREEPLLVGSVMSNIGYGEATTGISAVTKVLLGYHRGELAANLNCDTPRNDVVGLREGRMKLLTDHHKFRRTFTAVNNLSVTGINAHILLCGQYKPKDTNRYKTDLPRLVTISGRKETSVNRVIDILKSHPVDPEELALLNNIHKSRVAGHLGRGYVILGTDKNQKTVSLGENASYFDDGRRPLWFLYSGMGSQWSGMGTALMKIPIFAKTMERCNRVLEPKGINIIDIITSPDPKIFDNILNSFVGITGIQIGLTDVLLALGLVPDNIIGHSVGELGCAYADGCLTVEETILSAYGRGLVSRNTKFIHGAMAAVGLGYEEISQICPPEIEVACHNSSESSTISGPADKVKEFVAQLTAKSIFAKEVASSNIAYHSRYITEAGPGFLKYLRELIQCPKARSDRWLSTSIPESRWDEHLAKYSSAEYHTNNLLSPVLFEETCKHIPSNAVVVEIAPHGLLQAIVKRSLPQSCTNIPLTRRGHSDNALMVLDAIGKLYMEGCNPNLEALYPKVEFPVSTGTPLLSHLVDWAHDELWSLPLYSTANRTVSASCKFIVSNHDDEHSYLKGHVIKNKTVLPFSFVLVAAWDTLAMVLGVTKKTLSVKFSDVYLYAQPILHNQRQVRLSVSLHRGSGYFEIMDESWRVATGYIQQSIKNKGYRSINESETSKNLQVTYDLSGQDVYQILYERDYSYSGEFQSIHSVNDTITEGRLIWRDNWVTLIDGMLQLNVLKYAHNSISRPSLIRSIAIKVEKHTECLQTVHGTPVLPAKISDIHDHTRCGGITIEDIKFSNLTPVLRDQVVLKLTKFSEQSQCLSANEEIDDMILQSEQIGNLNSLKWVQYSESKSGIPVTVHYTGLHIEDAKRALGVALLKHENNTGVKGYGIDFSGITEWGEKIMGLVENGSAKSKVIAEPNLIWPVPSHWSLEDAATVPLAYAYAFYCLSIRATRIVKNQVKSVLVHEGTEAVGQAMISVFLASGYSVFATVSDVMNKQFLLRLFPEIKEENIGSSRDGTFADMVLAGTDGIGADVVINTLKGELKNYSLKCCSKFGVTFDIVQFHSSDEFSLGMHFLTQERSYYVVNISSIFSNEKFLKNIQAVMCDGISRGFVRPLSRVTYEAHEAPRAFRLLDGNKHRGRVLLKLAQSLTPVQNRLVCSPDSSYLICYDSETLGFQVADSLIECGAKKLHLFLTKPTGHLQYKLRWWKNQGVDVAIVTKELVDSNSVNEMIYEMQQHSNIAGVFIANTCAEHSSFINSVDVATRKLCPKLKHFLVLSVIDNTENSEKICQKRCRDGLPSTHLNLNKLIDRDHRVLHRYSSEAIKQSLCYSDALLTAHLKQLPKLSVLQQITALTGINIDDNTPDDSTLKELGVEVDKYEIITDFLSNHYNVSIKDDLISSLTVKSIKEIEKMSEGLMEIKEGLGCFFTYVDPDELLATTEMVSLPTLTNNSQMRDDEFNRNEKYLWLVPGIEGHHERFRTLCERLKLPAFVLQPGLDYLHEDPQQLANRYAKVLLKKMELKDNFYLLGYETGVTVALELAAMLEEQGLTGTIFCIGDGPEEIRKYIGEQMKMFTSDEELQLGVIRHMFSLMEGGDVSQLESSLSRCSSWVERVDVCVRVLLGHVSHSVQYVRALIEAAYLRLKTARQYRTSLKLRSQIVLLRAKSSNTATSTLQKYSTEPMKVYELGLPLGQATNDLRCAAIINKHLSNDILETYNKRNLCESYLLNACSFMQKDR